MHCRIQEPYLPPELQKRANRANQLVLFFLAGANFWEKHAKTGEKQRFFGAKFFVGVQEMDPRKVRKIWQLIFDAL